MRRPATLIVALTLAAPAWAGDDAPAAERYRDWQVITQDDATSTSRCIGRADTPVCAVETLIACHRRHQPTLCGIATGEPRKFSTRPFPGERQHYRIRRVSPIMPEDFARQHLGHYGTEPWHPGDMLVETVEDTCIGTYCDQFLWDMIYVLRQIGTDWRVVDWQPVIMD